MRNQLAFRKYDSLLTLFVVLLAAIVLLLIVAVATAQEKVVQPKQTTTTEKNSTSGRELYLAHCAVCHGVGGKGDGPAASAFKIPPANLTTLSKNNKGKYPAQQVYFTLRFGTSVPAHGNKQMPIWYNAFHSMNGATDEDSIASLRMTNLTDYIESIQVK